MDNFFEILIYLFLIISFLSSFFKKKKKIVSQLKQSETQVAGQQGTSGVMDVEAGPPVQTQQQDYDIFKEFEDFFKVGQPDLESHIPTKTESFEKSEVSNKEFNHVPEESFHTKTASEHTFVDPWDVKKSEIDERKKSIDSNIEKKAAAFERHLKKPETSATIISRKIRENMKRPSTLKEYVIISEIMGKPKAFKR